MLTDRFDQVVVLDRDTLPAEAVPRRGVPQGAHGHVLLLAGQRALDGLFPGLLSFLVREGATDFDPGQDLSIYRYGIIWPRAATGMRLLSFSRPLLELTLRERLLEGSQVEIRSEVAVSGLVAGESGQVTGVRLDDGSVLPAELVVDCSGRGSRSDRWLAAFGYRGPAVSEVKIGVGYATQLYRRSPGDLHEGEAVFVMPTAPGGKRAGLVLPIEGDRWLISLGGWHGAYPKDEAGFAEHASSLPHPAPARLLGSCEPLSDLTCYSFPSSRRRHFEDVTRVPGGYVALGDAICSFNPIYGQGMTCAALEAVALGELLDEYRSPSPALSAAFYRRAAEIIATPWQFASGGDFAYPETLGDRPRGIGLLNKYSRQIQLAAQVDLDVRKAFTGVQQMVLPPSVLKRPSMIWNVLRAARKAPGRRALS